MDKLKIGNISISGWIVTVFLFTLPFAYSRNLFYSAMNAKSFLVVIFISILAVIFSYKLFKGEISFYFIKKPVFWFISLFAMSMILSSFFGVYPELSFWSQILRGGGVVFILYTLLLSVFSGILLNRDDWKLARRSIVLSGGLFSLFYFLGTQGFGLDGVFATISFGINGLTFGNETFAGAYILLSLIISLLEYRNSTNSSRKWILGAILFQSLNPLFVNFGIWSGGIDILSNPTSVIGSAQASSITMFLVYIFILGNFIISKIKNTNLRIGLKRVYILISILSVVLGITLLFTKDSIVQRFYSEQSTGARLLVWEGAQGAIRERPILGWGYDNFQVAYQKNFDNRLFQEEYVGEIWFDRAHNFFIDMVVSFGYLGLLTFALLVASLVFVFEKSRKKGFISNNEMVLLCIFLVVYILQLQTSFETISTYVMLSFVVGYSIFLSKEDEKEKIGSKNIQIFQKFVAVILTSFVFMSSYKMVLAEHKRQIALVDIFRTKATDFEKREELINSALSRTESYESIRMASSGFIGGVLNGISSGSVSQDFVKNSLTELSLYESYYEKYIESSPLDYRARMQLSYLLMVKTILGEPSTQKAREYISHGYELSPNNPLTYLLESLSYLYEGNIAKAKELANIAIEMNPNIELSKKVMSHIEKQEKTFPVISFMKLENL